MRRRRSLPPDLAAAEASFDAVVAALEPGKRALTDAVPGTRLPGAPLPAALATFLGALERAAPGMPAWRHPAVEEGWVACDAGLREARVRAARSARDDAPEPSGFEGLLGLVESLLDPLDPFADAERMFRDLRRRRHDRWTSLNGDQRPPTP